MNKLLYYKLCALVLLSNYYVQAQSPVSNWYFGNQCAVTWNSGSPVALTNSAMNQYEGSASISDDNGNLLFYTDGISAWNANHAIMPNGNGMMGNFSTNQSALIVPVPGSTTQYYLFSNSSFSLYYSIVDMTLQSGLGDVTTKNVLLNSACSEKLAGVRHANGSDYWVMVHGTGGNTLYAYEVTAGGVNSIPVTSSIGINDVGSIGQMMFSPDGQKVAFGTYGGSFNMGIFDFDAATGVVSNNIDVPVPNQVYGLCFAPNSKILYRGSNPFMGQLFQYDLQAGSPAAVIASETMVASGFSNDEGHLQIGPDGKVYLARDGLSMLGAIEYPDSLGLACSWNPTSLPLAGKISGLGLPNFVQSYFNKSAQIKNFCFGDSTFFTIQDSANYVIVSWTFGDPASGIFNSATNFSTAHVFTAPGTYNVELITVNINSFIDTSYYSVTINPAAVPALGNDSTLCIGQTLTLNPGSFSSYLWQNGSTSASYTATVNGMYFVDVQNSSGCKGSDTILINFIPCTTPIAALSSSDTIWCEKDCIDFFDLSLNNPTSWTWYFQGASPSSSTDQNPQSICYNNYGKFDVALVACSNLGCDSIFFNDFIVEHQKSGPSTISLINDTLWAVPAFGYQWYLNNNPIANATAQWYQPTTDGNYYVVIIDSNGCSVSSFTFGFYTDMPQWSASDIGIYHSAINDALFIKSNDITLKMEVIDGNGKIILSDKITMVNGVAQASTASWSAGMYHVRLIGKEKFVVRKIIIRK